MPRTLFPGNASHSAFVLVPDIEDHDILFWIGPFFGVIYRHFLLPLWFAHTEPVHVSTNEFTLKHPVHDIHQKKSIQ